MAETVSLIHPEHPSLNYDGAPRPITEDEAKQIAHEEYIIRGIGSSTKFLSRGADGGYHLREQGRGQLMVTVCNARRKDLRDRIMAGKCQNTVFYDRARDRFYCA